jgi:cytochrome c-type biogenesis protein CcsB
MVNAELAQTSNTLFHAAFLLYIAAMIAYFFRLAFTRVTAEGGSAGTAVGRRVGYAGTALAVVGVVVHAGSVLARAFAVIPPRVPWANMYEYSSLLALAAVAVGLIVVQRRLGYGHLMGFVLALAVLSMTSALLLFTEAGPVVPALDSYWIKIHTSSAMLSSSIFMIGFAATALYLVKDIAERRVAERSGSRFGASTVGAASVRSAPGGLEGPPVADLESEPETRDSRDVIASPLAQRAVLSPVLFPVVPFVAVAAFTLAVWRAPIAALAAGSVAALLGTVTWYAVPHLPPATSLDNLAYRTVAFAFPIWTFAVIAGAIWAEEAWGRYWGWDPKETGSFFTWVLYASYLHARSTHGWRGRRAAWIGVIAFVALMITYYAVNLWVVGLHSYAGV